MLRLRSWTSRTRTLAALAALTVTGLVACASKPDASVDTTKTAAASAPAMGDSAKMATPAGMGGMAMSGNPDQDFLRMMSDHHKGLIAIVHATVDSKKKVGVMAIAKKLDTEQDAELDTMSTMLEKTFKDPYAPKIAPEHQAMVDGLSGLTGAAYDKAFLQDIIKHHESAIPMIDAYLPQAKNQQVKAMAERMKAAQTKEIADFKKKLGDMP